MNPVGKSNGSKAVARRRARRRWPGQPAPDGAPAGVPDGALSGSVAWRGARATMTALEIPTARGTAPRPADRAGRGAAGASAVGSGRTGAGRTGSRAAGPRGRTGRFHPAGLHLVSGSIAGCAGAPRPASAVLHLVAGRLGRSPLLGGHGAAAESESGENDDREASH